MSKTDSAEFYVPFRKRVSMTIQNDFHMKRFGIAEMFIHMLLYRFTQGACPASCVYTFDGCAQGKCFKRDQHYKVAKARIPSWDGCCVNTRMCMIPLDPASPHLGHAENRKGNAKAPSTRTKE